eukprot:7948986-Lingulodinium_polyedra.AAC.1
MCRVGPAWVLVLLTPDGDATVHRGGVTLPASANVPEETNISAHSTSLGAGELGRKLGYDNRDLGGFHEDSPPL